tara:strand:- start:2005 stop:2382 length:378 start_codon:yes stop_codon:yes gene_type:complete
MRPPGDIIPAGDDSALERPASGERQLERLDKGDEPRESGPMVRSPESSVDVRRDRCPRWISAKSPSETLRSVTTGEAPGRSSRRVLVLGLCELGRSLTVLAWSVSRSKLRIACCPPGDVATGKGR